MEFGTFKILEYQNEGYLQRKLTLCIVTGNYVGFGILAKIAAGPMPTH